MQSFTGDHDVMSLFFSEFTCFLGCCVSFPPVLAELSILSELLGTHSDSILSYSIS
jgi:hypothetical protein